MYRGNPSTLLFWNNRKSKCYSFIHLHLPVSSLGGRGPPPEKSTPVLLIAPSLSLFAGFAEGLANPANPSLSPAATRKRPRPSSRGEEPRAFHRETAFHFCSLQSHQSLIPTFLCSRSLPSPSAAASSGLSETSRGESKTSKGNGAVGSGSFSGGNPGLCESCTQAPFGHFP